MQKASWGLAGWLRQLAPNEHKRDKICNSTGVLKKDGRVFNRKRGFGSKGRGKKGIRTLKNTMGTMGEGRLGAETLSKDAKRL